MACVRDAEAAFVVAVPRERDLLQDRAGLRGALDSPSDAVASKLYLPEKLALVPRSAVEGALGVGNHLGFAKVEPGETILDIGCGFGIDSILAADRTGPTGRVIALDFLPEMLVPCFLRHGRKESVGLIVGERQQGQLFTSVEPGDDTRRPAAELSGAGIEQNRTREPRDRHVVIRFSCHPTSLRRQGSGMPPA